MIFQESNTVELKEKFVNSICKEIVSFFNADGGTIYIGVKDDGTIIGSSNIDGTCRSVADIITQQMNLILKNYYFEIMSYRCLEM